MPYLTPAALAADLAVRDLTDPAAGPHALQLLIDDILSAVTARWPDATLTVHRGDRVVDVADNYDSLGYTSQATTRDARYTRYVAPGRMLRSQTSALIPGALRVVTATEALIACPGIVYRRDAIDRLHTGTPHQLDLWRLTTGPANLHELAAVVLAAALPGIPWRTRPALHPYTTDGLELQAHVPESGVRTTIPPPSGNETGTAATEISSTSIARGDGARGYGAAGNQISNTRSVGLGSTDRARSRSSAAHDAAAEVAPGGGYQISNITAVGGAAARSDGAEMRAREGEWVEVGECGVAAGHVLRRDGVVGLALGLGLDRLLMLRKGIDDIRLLRSGDPRVASQMLDLAPYRAVSVQPAACRDLSVAAPGDVTAEDLGDRIRELLGTDARLVEEVTILSVAPAAALPAVSRERLGLRDDEVNVLLRVVLRDLHGTLPKQRANALRDRIWEGLMSSR